jgi:16S rRNA (cytosine1402-N4)-methyltransferase
MLFHMPVLVDEVVQGLVVNPCGTYLDATAGGGGHSKAILHVLNAKGYLAAVDRDAEAVQTALQGLEKFADRALILRGSFAELKCLLEEQKIRELHGVLFDLGVSSHQIDAPERGFSYRLNGPLDMRMDTRQEVSASELIARSSEAELGRIIKQFGEERKARHIARAICRGRACKRIETTAELRAAVEAARPQNPTKTLARVFQAFRIAVNDELGQLEKGVETAISLLASGGRLAVIAYHSLEDRLVKTKFTELVRGCTCPREFPLCICGKKPTFKKIGSKVRRPGAKEVEVNPRARSARLRIFEKL